jgi:hypothetical protein
VVGEQRHGLCPDFGEELFVARSSEDEVVVIDFGDLNADSVFNFRPWRSPVKVAILYSKATQRKTTKKTTIAIYAKYRSPRIAKQKNLTEHRGRNNQERKSP